MANVMTLPEYAKGLPPGATKALVEMFAASSDIMSVLPFESMGGAVYEYPREASLPATMAFRGINEVSTTGAGTIEMFQESSFILDHDLDMDAAIVRRYGEERRNTHERLLIAKYGRVWANTFINGDTTTQPREFNGIKKRISMYGLAAATNTRTLNNSAASGGAALSLTNLDKLLNMVNGANFILAPRNMIPLFISAARNTTIAGFVIQTWDQIGMPKMTYAGRRILFGYERELEGDLLDFNEVAIGGGAAVTGSIYAMRFGDAGLRGLQLKPLEAKDCGLLENQITLRTHVSGDVGLLDEHPFCLARLTSITNAAFVT